MELIENRVIINAKTDNKQLSVLAEEILAHIDEIKEIVVDYKNGVESSALFSLLYSVQKTNSEIKITMLDDGICNVDGIGLMSLNIG